MIQFNLAPNNILYNGQLKSWEDTSFGYRSLFRYIHDASRFREVMDSLGQDELIELYDPYGTLNHSKIKLRFLDPDTDLRTGKEVILDKDNVFTIIPQGSRYEMDTTESTGSLAYTSLIYGEKPLMSLETNSEY